MNQKYLALLLVAICCFSGVLPADTVSLDGAVLAERILPLDLGGDLADTIMAVESYPGGRVLVAGRTSSGSGAWTMFVARFLADGALDPSFGSGGVALSPFGACSHCEAVAVAVLPDQKIIVGGTIDYTGGGADFLVGKLQASGIPDSGFAFNGLAQFGFGGLGSTHRLSDITVSPSGRIVAVGTAYSDQTDSEFAVAVLDPFGTLDSTFGGTGLRIISVDLSGDFQDVAQGVAVDQYDRITVAGTSWHQNGFGGPWSYDFAAIRLEMDGTLDTSFGIAGRMVVPYDFGGSLHDRAHSVAIDQQGKTVVAGEVAIGPGVGNKSWAVLRLTVLGTRDGSFGVGGWATGTFACGGLPSCAIRDTASALSIQSNGTILLAGTTFDLGHQMFGSARLTSDGVLDPTYGGLWGAMQWDLAWGAGSGDDIAFAAAVEDSGNLLVAGQTEYNGFDTDLAWIRIANGAIFADGFESGDTSKWQP